MMSSLQTLAQVIISALHLDTLILKPIYATGKFSVRATYIYIYIYIILAWSDVKKCCENPLCIYLANALSLQQIVFLQLRYDRSAISFILHTHHWKSDCIIGLLFDSPGVNKEIKRRPSYLGHVVAIRGACSKSVPLKCCQMRGVSKFLFLLRHNGGAFQDTHTKEINVWT